MPYLTLFLNLFFLINIRRKSRKWQSLYTTFFFFNNLKSRYHNLMSHLITLSNLLSITCIIKKLGMTKSAFNFCLFYSNKLIDNATWTFSSAVQPSLVGKKRKPPRVVLDFFSHFFNPLSLLFSLTLFKICTVMSELQLSLILANFPLASFF